MRRMILRIARQPLWGSLPRTEPATLKQHAALRRSAKSSRMLLPSAWLIEFGTSLEEEFGIDPFYLLVLASFDCSLPLRSLAQLLDKHGRARGDFRERIGLAVVVDPGHQAVEVHLGQNIQISGIPIQA